MGNRYSVCSYGEEYRIRVKYQEYTVLPLPPSPLLPTIHTLFKAAKHIMALFNFLYVMMNGPQKDPLLYPIWHVGRFMNIRDVHKKVSTSACSVQYVCLVLFETDMRGC
jgi:hypothetical protein